MHPLDLASWHNFFAVIGGAAGTLIGALFVVASLGIGYLTAERAAGMRVFLTPVIAHVSGVLIGCALVMVPSLDLRTLAGLLGVGSVGGLCYSGLIAYRALQHEIDRADRLWYAAMPVVAYGIMAAAAFAAFRGHAVSIDILAGAMVVLMVASLRNAWDMVLFLVTRERPN